MSFFLIRVMTWLGMAFLLGFVAFGALGWWKEYLEIKNKKEKNNEKADSGPGPKPAS